MIDREIACAAVEMEYAVAVDDILVAVETGSQPAVHIPPAKIPSGNIHFDSPKIKCEA